MKDSISNQKSTNQSAENGAENPTVWCMGTPPNRNHIPQLVMLHREQFGYMWVWVGHCPQCGKEFTEDDKV